MKSPLVALALILALIVLVTALAPLEKTLGANARIVYLHGAWVWAAQILFLLAGLSGLAGLVLQFVPGIRPAVGSPGIPMVWHRWSTALGRTGLLFWLTFLPMSLYVMQANWNGLFLDEPRFRVPLNFAIIGLLLQVGLAILARPAWISLANLGFSIALFVGLRGMQTVLHPDSPLLSPGAGGIRLFFGALLVLLLLAGYQICRLWASSPEYRPVSARA